MWSAVHFAAMSDPDHPDDQFRILDLADQPVIADAVAPFLVVSLERFAGKARVDGGLDLVYKLQDAFVYGFVSRSIAFDATSE